MAGSSTWRVISIKEATKFFIVRVKVEDKSVLFPSLQNEFFDLIDSWSGCSGRTFPCSIWVYPSYLCSRVAMNDSIRINHWNNFEGVVIKRPILF